MEPTTPERPARSHSSGGQSCTCSIRCGMARTRGAAASTSRASSTAASPMACTVEAIPACAARCTWPRNASGSSVRIPTSAPVPSYGARIQAVRDPSAPSRNIFTPPVRSHALPKPLRSPTATACSRRGSAMAWRTRSRSSPSASMAAKSSSPVTSTE